MIELINEYEKQIVLFLVVFAIIFNGVFFYFIITDSVKRYGIIELIFKTLKYVALSAILIGLYWFSELFFYGFFIGLFFGYIYGKSFKSPNS